MKRTGLAILITIQTGFVATSVAGATAEEVPEKKAREKAHWSKMARVAEGQIEDIKFVGRVIDQDGAPVAGAEVFMEGGSNFLASGSGKFTVTTDQDGYFEVIGKKGLYLRLGYVKKNEYDIDVSLLRESGEKSNPHFYGFKESRDAMVWTDYTHGNPYVIKAWRVDRYAKVKFGKGIELGFDPDGTVETLDFDGVKRVKWKGFRQGDIKVSAKRSDKEWMVTVESIDGWLSEAGHSYNNMAPEVGDQKKLIFSGATNGNIFASGSIEVNKNFYFMSRNGKRYGVVTMRIFPYFDEQTVISASYVINLEGGRELAVRPEER